MGIQARALNNVKTQDNSSMADIVDLHSCPDDGLQLKLFVCSLVSPNPQAHWIVGIP